MRRKPARVATRLRPSGPPSAGAIFEAEPEGSADDEALGALVSGLAVLVLVMIA
jgi:hypothetical protein